MILLSCAGHLPRHHYEPPRLPLPYDGRQADGASGQQGTRAHGRAQQGEVLGHAQQGEVLGHGVLFRCLKLFLTCETASFLPS